MNLIPEKPGKATNPKTHPILSNVSPDLLDTLIDEHCGQTLPRLRRRWNYYRNPVDDFGQPAQQQGLPARLRLKAGSDTPAREQVIENDIAWRIHAGIDFMIASPLVIQSTVKNPQLAASIDQLLNNTFDAAGGFRFFQDLSLLGSVYGHIDAIVHLVGAQVQLELIEPTRGIPLLNVDDYRQHDAYIVHYHQQTHELTSPSLLTRVRDHVLGGASTLARRAVVERTRVFSAHAIDAYVSTRHALGTSRTRVESMPNRLGRVPVVHIQNLPQPFSYQGLSDVEPLIELQDELNTRLSDRANRVTFQSFKMYLGKGIEHFTDRPVGPGQMWATDNPDASIEAFGSDSASPSEDAHIAEIREALDKTSGISPLAAGVLRDKVGNLTSENALRIVMMGLLTRTEKKRSGFGRGIAELCELILHAADITGQLSTTPEQRRVRIDWPDPLPVNEAQQLRNAQTKLELGIPRKQVLAELNYHDCTE